MDPVTASWFLYPTTAPIRLWRGFECVRDAEPSLKIPKTVDSTLNLMPVPECGPQLSLLDSLGNNIASGQWAVAEAASALRRGELLALKGLGGFQLFVDARFSEPVARLRIRKHRPDKPFAVMLPSLSAVETLCHVSELEREILTSPQAPIVLLQRRRTARDGEHSIADPVAPNNPYLGVMLPYTPLHHILMREFGHPLRGDQRKYIGRADVDRRG